MADELGDQQEHIEYLELRRVWKNIGLTLTNAVLQEWRTKYPVNIAVLDSGVKEDHQAFQSKSDLPKVLNSKSFVAAENDTTDVLSHGTFCAGYLIPSPKKIKDYKVQKLAETVVLSGGDLEDFPFVGVAPFANIISYKVIDDNDMLNEEALACALRDLVEHNSRVGFKEKIHIVSMSLSAHYHDGVRRALYDVLNDDMIVVAAACNMGQKNNYCNGNIWFPARFGNVISIGSHDNHGQPSKISSVGREVDFLAPGEEIWGPSADEKENSIFIGKDEGTSMPSAIVSGIVALVLAFVHKEKGADVRAKIANNPVMKEILGKMATKKGQHDKVEGYGSLNPLRIFGHRAYILRNFIENLPSMIDVPFGAGDIKVSKFILRETSLPMTSVKEYNSAVGVNEISQAEISDRDASYPYNYHEDRDPTRILPWRYELFMKSTQDALDYLERCGLTNRVEVINLNLPLFYSGRERDQRKLSFQKVLNIIRNSRVETIDHFVFPHSEHLYWKDLCQFIISLPPQLLSRIKSIVMPDFTPLGVLCRIAHILQENEATTYIYVNDIDSTTRTDDKQTCEFPEITTVKVITNVYPEVGKQRNEQYGFKIPFNFTQNASDDEPCVAEIRSSGTFGIAGSSELQACSPPNVFYPPPLNEFQHPNITVAILGDAINIHHSEINGKIKLDSNLKSFTVPSGGTVESHRHLGTFCASIIAGETEGIAPFVNLVYATVINAKGTTKPEWVISALKWIESKHPDVHVVVIPLGFAEFNLELFKIINRLSKNMVIVCAAGIPLETIRPAEICYPARYGDVICVGSHSSLFHPSSYSPQGREIDFLARECVAFKCFSVYTPECYNNTTTTDSPEIVLNKHSLSGTCIAAAYAAGVIAQIVAFALQCGFERQQITNNTVMRELLKHLTCNFSHDPCSGYGWLKDLSRSELLKNSDYFTSIVQEILGGGGGGL